MISHTKLDNPTDFHYLFWYDFVQIILINHRLWFIRGCAKINVNSNSHFGVVFPHHFHMESASCHPFLSFRTRNSYVIEKTHHIAFDTTTSCFPLINHIPQNRLRFHTVRSVVDGFTQNKKFKPVIRLAIISTTDAIDIRVERGWLPGERKNHIELLVIRCNEKKTTTPLFIGQWIHLERTYTACIQNVHTHTRNFDDIETLIHAAEIRRKKTHVSVTFSYALINGSANFALALRTMMTWVKARTTSTAHTNTHACH